MTNVVTDWACKYDFAYIFLRTGQIAYTKLQTVLSRWQNKSTEVTEKKLTGINKKFGPKWQKDQVEKLKARLRPKTAPEQEKNTQENTTSLSPKLKTKLPQLQEKFVNIQQQLAKKSEVAKATANLITSDIREEVPHVKNKANSLRRSLSQRKVVPPSMENKAPISFDAKLSTLKKNVTEKGKSIKDASSEWNANLTKNVASKKQAFIEATADWQQKSRDIVQQIKPKQGP